MLSVYFGQGLCIIKCVIVLFFALTAGVLNEICCLSREAQPVAFVLQGSWACSFGFSHRTGPTRHSQHSHRLPSPQHQKHGALSLPSVNPTYNCSGHPVNTSISSITSYLLGLTTSQKVRNGIWQCHPNIRDPTSVSLCRPFHTQPSIVISEM